jgi:hypothetical protein
MLGSPRLQIFALSAVVPDHAGKNSANPSQFLSAVAPASAAPPMVAEHQFMFEIQSSLLVG